VAGEEAALKRLASLFLSLQQPTLGQQLDSKNLVHRLHRPILLESISTDSSAAGLDGKDTSFRKSDVFSYTAGFTSASSKEAHANMTWLAAMQETLRALREPGFEVLPVEDKFLLQTNEARGAKIVNMAFQSKVFRKIRLTYLDVGDKAQAFNAMFYPSYEYDLPMLGIDLISLGRKRIIAGIDFQPLYKTDDYNAKYIDVLTPIRAKYENLQDEHSGKIYDDSTFFSDNMLLGHFSDEAKADSEIIPASNEYLHAYLELAKTAVPDDSESGMAAVRERQARYDEYNAEKDPAIGFFNAYLGKEWSESFVHDFLFELSREQQQVS
jgi:15,16-dihydrobiliverdin:ferredoxin oxidoreductase